MDPIKKLCKDVKDYGAAKLMLVTSLTICSLAFIVHQVRGTMHRKKRKELRRERSRAKGQFLCKKPTTEINSNAQAAMHAMDELAASKRSPKATGKVQAGQRRARFKHSIDSTGYHSSSSAQGVSDHKAITPRVSRNASRRGSSSQYHQQQQQKFRNNINNSQQELQSTFKSAKVLENKSPSHPANVRGVQQDALFDYLLQVHSRLEVSPPHATIAAAAAAPSQQQPTTTTTTKQSGAKHSSTTSNSRGGTSQSSRQPSRGNSFVHKPIYTQQNNQSMSSVAPDDSLFSSSLYSVSSQNRSNARRSNRGEMVSSTVRPQDTSSSSMTLSGLSSPSFMARRRSNRQRFGAPLSSTDVSSGSEFDYDSTGFTRRFSRRLYRSNSAARARVSSSYASDDDEEDVYDDAASNNTTSIKKRSRRKNSSSSLLKHNVGDISAIADNKDDAGAASKHLLSSSSPIDSSKFEGLHRYMHEDTEDLPLAFTTPGRGNL